MTAKCKHVIGQTYESGLTGHRSVGLVKDLNSFMSNFEREKIKNVFYIDHIVRAMQLKLRQVKNLSGEFTGRHCTEVKSPPSPPPPSLS